MDRFKTTRDMFGRDMAIASLLRKPKNYSVNNIS